MCEPIRRSSWTSALFPARTTPHIVPILIWLSRKALDPVWRSIMIRATRGDGARTLLSVDDLCKQTHMTHWWRGWEVVGIMRMDRVEHRVV